MTKRVKLRFAPNLEIEFTNREKAVRQIHELAEKGTGIPRVVYGPEGCGKQHCYSNSLKF
jgi:hypothetical protein|uniref:ATPase domain-containing protein n=1 Tax=Ignisphaera aggregans TaxID=334771 RepID=A0A7J2U2Z6_9CREN